VSVAAPVWAAAVTACGGLVAGTLAYLGGRRGQNLERTDEKAQRVMEGQGQAFEHLDKVIGRLEGENERLTERRERLQKDLDDCRGRLAPPPP
jgi:septal ring factor EnvC (AmiA/AmiB activator)